MARRLYRLVLIVSVVATGLWLLARAASPSPDSLARQEAVRQALAPGRPGSDTGNNLARPVAREGSESVKPVTVDLRDVPAGPSAVDRLHQRYLDGEIDLGINDGPVDGAAFQSLLEESAAQPPDTSIQNYTVGSAIQALNLGTNFKSIDYTQSQQGVPPDPDITAGRDHIIAAVNTSFQVFDKTGTSLVGPTLFESFWGANCGSGSNVVMFDPFLDYDEQVGRYILGITAYDPAINGGDNGWACIAVSTSDSATGTWYLYSFDGNPGGGTDYFFDYPHLGVGQQALYLSANMFGAFFVRNHVFAFDKSAMYDGLAANSIKLNVGSANFTLQPAKIHGYAFGGWPSDPNEPHYFVDAQYGNGQNTLTVWAFSDPFGAPSLTQAGTVIVDSYSLPVSQPQLGGSNIQGNDNRLLDVKQWGGKLVTTHHIGCNPGSGTVNCLRWYEIDISSGSPALVQQGTLASNGFYRSFPAIAPNLCGDLLVGYTGTSTSTYPSVYVAGRQAGDLPGQLKDETLLHAGEDFYTAYDSVPRRWGDYTGMAIDPDGVTFWYVGEYSRNQATARWSTWIGAFQWPDCSPVPTPTPTAGPSPTPTNTPTPTATPLPTTCTVYPSTDVPKAISSSGTPSVSSVLNVPAAGIIVDVNVVGLNGTHTWISDLDFNLISPAGTAVQIMAQSCTNQDNFNLNLDDEVAPGAWPCPPTDGGTYRPSNPLSTFDGEAAAGTWTLRVDDNANRDGGSLDGWGLEICVPDAPPTPTPTNTPIPPTPTSTPEPVRLGDRVWLDADGNGLLDAGEMPLSGIQLNLLAADGSPILDGLGNPVTTVTDPSGAYLFDGLAAGDYRVEVDASNFAPGGALERADSTVDDAAGPGQTADPNGDTDGDDNGPGTSASAKMSGVVSLQPGLEPMPAQDGDDANGNLTVDFGFRLAPTAIRLQESRAEDAGNPPFWPVSMLLLVGALGWWLRQKRLT